MRNLATMLLCLLAMSGGVRDSIAEFQGSHQEAHLNQGPKKTGAASGTVNYFVEENLFYKNGSDLSSYEKERCFLDLYLPQDQKNFPVIVWFHGGSLARGSKEDGYTREMARHFARQGIAVAVVNYRLSPAAGYPSYIEDAAASVAWVVGHADEYDIDPKAVFIGGHSAGGYLTYMLGMDRVFLEAQGVDIEQIAGLIPISGQTFTHYTIRKERGVPNPETTPTIDDASPCYHAQESGPPILVICGDGDPRDRIEENRYFLALLKKIGYENSEYREMKNRNHWELILKIPTEGDPLSEAIATFISTQSRPSIVGGKR